MFVDTGCRYNDSVDMALVVFFLLISVFGVDQASGEHSIRTKGGNEQEQSDWTNGGREASHKRIAREASVAPTDARSKPTRDANLTTIPATPTSYPNSTFNTTTLITTTFNTTTNVTEATTTTEVAPKEKGSVGGTIVGVIFGVLLGGAILGGGLYLLIRYKRAQTAEYNRATQVQMSSTRNAGVYVDLAEPSLPGRQGGEYISLKQQNEAKSGKKDTLIQSDLYEYDTDDEV